MNRENALANARNPITILTVVLVMTWAVLAGLSWLSYRSYQQTKTTTERRLRIQELRGSIIHLEEVLTMSAHMAAFTGDLHWEKRYRRFEPQLDAAMKEAMRLALEADSGEATAKTGAACIKHVEMENRVFDLVRQGRVDEAKAVLSSAEYKTLQQVHTHELTRFARPKERHLRLTELRSTIIHLEEVLTMSAHMAAFTGDLHWEKRYRRFEPQLDAAIKDAIALAPGAHSGQAAAETDAANIKLVEMENRAFDLVRQGRAEEAKAVLFSDEYESQKRTCAEGMNEFATGLADAVSSTLKREQRLSFLLVGAECLLMPCLIVGWLVVFRAVRHWKTTLAKQAEELAEVNQSLDQKVAERTEALRDAKDYTDNIINSMADMLVVVSPDGSIVTVNQAACNLLGYPEQELIGQPASLLFVEEEEEEEEEDTAQLILSQHSLPVKRTVLRRLMKEGSVSNVEKSLLTKSGDRIPVLLSGAVMRDEEDKIRGIVCLALDVTERKRAEEKLRAISHSALDAIIMMDSGGNVAHWNPAAEKMFGYSSKEIMGRDVHAVLTPAEYREQAMQGQASFAKSGKGPAVGKTLELEAQRKDGPRFPIEISVSPIKLEDRWWAVAIVRDITEQKRAQAELRESREFLQTVIDAIPDTMMVIGRDYRIVLANRAAWRWSGDKHPVTECLKCHQVLRNSDAPCEGLTSPCPLEQTVVTRAPVRVEHIHSDPEGNDVFLEVSSAPVFDESNEVVQVVESCRDITDRKNADVKQKQLQCELVHAQKLESVGQLAAGIAHEINTPTQYVGDNTRFLKEAFGQITSP